MDDKGANEFAAANFILTIFQKINIFKGMEETQASDALVPYGYKPDT